eukprot:scpid7234/ scgid15813/ 
MQIRIADPANFRSCHRTRVFDVDTNENATCVRCALPVCTVHRAPAEHDWLPNTDDNVRKLEDHVGEEIEAWLEKLSRNVQTPRPINKFKQQVVVDWFFGDPNTASKCFVIAILELNDEHAVLGKWVGEFLRAALALDSFCGELIWPCPILGGGYIYSTVRFSSSDSRYCVLTEATACS